MGMAVLSVVVMLAPLLFGIMARMVSAGHNNGRALAVVWAAFIANTFIVMPLTLLVIVAGFIHVIRSRQTVSGLWPLTGSLAIVMVSVGGGFWLIRSLFQAAM